MAEVRGDEDVAVELREEELPRLGSRQIARIGVFRRRLAEDADAVVAAAVADRLAVIGPHPRAVGQFLQLVGLMPRGVLVQFLQRDHVGVHQRDDLGRVVVVRAVGPGVLGPSLAAVGVVGRQPHRVGQAVVTLSVVGIVGSVGGHVPEIEVGVVALQPGAGRPGQRQAAAGEGEQYESLDFHNHSFFQVRNSGRRSSRGSA